eukprot:8183424-Pyramimonas_sp.AAC.1
MGLTKVPVCVDFAARVARAPKSTRARAWGARAPPDSSGAVLPEAFWSAPFLRFGGMAARPTCCPNAQAALEAAT